jgi:hypothetical protein
MLASRTRRDHLLLGACQDRMMRGYHRAASVDRRREPTNSEVEDEIEKEEAEGVRDLD